MAVHTRRRSGGGGDVEVIELSPADFKKAKKAALESIGLTYRELARQAKRGEFSSPRAHKVWIAIGGHRR
jgi:hypothetical protein